MTYKQILTPDKKNHSIEIPEQFFGKTIEVNVVELNGTEKSQRPTPPKGKVTSADELLKHFGEAPDFPSIEEIRTKAWPSKW